MQVKNIAALLAGVILFLGSGCDNRKGRETTVPKKKLFNGDTANLTGAQLAQGYCQSCHLFPAPDLLPKSLWEYSVLPNMALRLGISSPDQNPFAGLSTEDILAISQARIFPDTPEIKVQDWEKIVQYYLATAPEKPLPQSKRIEPILGLPNFQPFVQPRKPGHFPETTLVKYDGETKQLFLGDKQSNLFVLDSKLYQTDSVRLNSPATDIFYKGANDVRVLLSGKIHPTDQTSGELIKIIKPKSGASTQATLISKLKRPVNIVFLDLNQDNQEDAIICNYGNHTGNLSWFEQKPNGYQEHILKNTPGARQVIARDLNRDGLPDLMVLFAQAQEGVYIYFNQGEGEFSEKAVLRFPPVYGSAYIDVADINKDGSLDILYANGDNADYSFTLKNYHGLRIFLNDGKNNFKLRWFYPMYGASKALAHDFDQDGDLDIAAISFFPDFASKPLEGFLYFENSGNLNFKPGTFKEADAGRWLTFDIGDVDQDQDTDIILGSFIQAPTPVPPALQARWRNSGASFLVLKNKLKK